MSWFGEQLSSFTEKITDFTKEVLIDDSATDKIDNSHENDTLSYKELLDLCKEKDLKINNLISEKASLENSIEELDQQHQEAIDALLLQKNQVISENNVLKEELANEKRKSFESSNGNLHALYTSSDLSCDIKNNVSEILCPELGDDINLISILQSVSDCSEDEKFKKQIDLLEKQKKLISNENKSNVNTDKIDNYINFLEALHSQSLYSVVDEICSIFNTLLSYNNQLRQTLKTTASAEDNGRQDLQIANKNTNCTCDCNIHYVTKFKLDSTASDSSIQNDLKVPVSDVSTQTDCNNFNSSHAEYVYLKTSKHSQTDDCAAEEQEHILLENNILIGQLKSSIQVLEEENLSLQENVCQLQSCLSKPKSNVLTQTDNDECDLAQEIVSTQEQSYITLQKKYSDDVKHLNEELQSRASLITALETEIQTLKTEISYLQEIIDDLKRNLFSKESEIADANAEMSALKNQILQQNSEVEKPLCSSPEIILLQEKLKSSELEKGKLLCVLNEKSQECSSLKSEVHKLTNIVASEKQALFKLQQDNCDLKHSSGDKSDPELTKEAIRKLSSLIKDKDLEIESLKQKNSTLTTLIQNVTSIPEHLQLLMEEKENLSKQVHQYNTERDKIMARFNAKDKECRERAAEMKKLNNQLAEKNKDFDILEQNYSSVIQQYEEKQKSLVNAQNEMVHLRQRTSELEQQLVDLKEKYSDLLNKINSEDTIQITKEELYDKDSRIEKLTCGNEEKDHLIQEKDCMIHDLSQQVKKFKLESAQQIHKIHEFEEKNSNLMDEIKETNSSTELLQREKCLLEQRFQDRSSELDLLKEMNERLNMAVKEKEFAIQSMTEKISSLSQYISSGPSSPGTADVNQILADSESMFSEAQKFRRERDETLLALNQSKQENQSLRNEIQRMKSNEIHLESQLSRLREHLLEVEENYTNEALKAEEREKSLKDELVEVKRRADITSTAVVDTNQRASIQIASLQEQLSMVANQRDEALAQISSLEDKVLQHSTSVNKLQLVLEQMQKGNERKIKDIDNKWQLQLQKQKEAVSQLEKQLQIKQMQLEESSKALEAASRLSEQLDAKEEVISNLKKELSKFENQIRSTTQEIDSIKSNTEGKVDRVVMKSLVLGYFSTPPGQKSEVIRLLARVLDFNQEEMEKAGIVVGRSTRRQESRGIFSSIFNRLPSLSSPEQNQQQPEKSFTTLFVQFLENESQPIVHMPFPVEKMAQELTSKNHPNKKGQTTSNNSSPRRSPLLLDIDSAFPTFTPLPAVEYSSSPAPAILKEVLE